MKVDMSPSEVLDEANSFMIDNGYDPENQTGTSANFKNGRDYNTILLIILLIIGIIIGLIYYFTRDKKAVTIRATEIEGGAEVNATGNCSDARKIANNFQQSLPRLEE